MPHDRLAACRFCGWEELIPVLSLGELAFPGVFPKPDEDVPRGPIDLVKCMSCGLVQMGHRYDPALLYGPTYGYRSGLNPSMVAHLRAVAAMAWFEARAEPFDTIVDIGANDGTLLGMFPQSCTRIGIDPLADKLADFWPKKSIRIASMFGDTKEWHLKGLKAKIVFSLACLYDAEAAGKWAQHVAEMLAGGGMWIIELMLVEHLFHGSWDQICHEHSLYFTPRQLWEICTRAGLRIVKVQETPTNGGSVLVFARKESGPHLWTPLERIPQDVREPQNWTALQEKIRLISAEARKCLESYKANGKIVWGYGASTKGNMLLQLAGIGPGLLPRIIDANQEKDGKETPGTRIPIFAHTRPWVAPPGLKDEGAETGDPLQWPHAFLVLPWHFRDFVIEKERAFLEAGGELIFALPRLGIVTRESLNRSKETAA